MSFYCSHKFNSLEVDLAKLETLSCCAAMPERVDREWLSENPGKIFNTDLINSERRDMLNDVPVASCESACWAPEKAGMVSRRMLTGADVVTDTNVNGTIRDLVVKTGQECNMECVYCCKENSTAWRNDIIQSGTYNVQGSGDRYTINDRDLLLHKISQKQRQRSTVHSMLVSEIGTLAQSTNLTQVTIVGGEPLLYNNLELLVSNIARPDLLIRINTGLGLSESRFLKHLELIKDKNVRLILSGETVGDLYNFTRYGNNWETFYNRVQHLKAIGQKYSFSCVLSNLTLIGFADFLEQFPGDDVNLVVCNTPNFLTGSVLDPETKDRIRAQQHKFTVEQWEIIEQILVREPLISERTNLRAYLLEYAERRSLSLDVFPESFIKWVFD